MAAGLLLALVLAAPAVAQGDPEEPCPGGGYNPTPEEVAVQAVPIVVESTTDDYFVLYVKHYLNGAEVEIPVAVTRGGAGSTTLAENVEALPAEHYRVEKYLIADPADVDGDCFDDITELNELGNLNPVNPAPNIDLSDGAVAIPDRDMFEALASRSGSKWHLKFVLVDMDNDSPRVYFQNATTHPHHPQFLQAVGLWGSGGLFRGRMTYDPELVGPDGSQGVYYYSYPYVIDYRFSLQTQYYTSLAASVPLLDDNLAFHVHNHRLPYIQSQLSVYEESRIPLLFDEDVYPETDFLALNPGEGYGRLRVTDPDERPHPRDIVLYEALPNDLPRVAGIISTVPQTPLSHVNLRAVQDGIPNAFIRAALDDTDIASLLGSYVHYTVTEYGWKLGAATKAEVDDHYAASRPAQAQARDATSGSSGSPR